MTTPNWLDRHLNVPCKVYNRIPSGTDEYGNVIYAEVETQTYCFIQPIAQEELEGGRGGMNQFLVHLRASIVGLLDTFARIEVNGKSYEAIEDPAVFTSLTSPAVHHVELVVQETTT